jgi:hypothetical protein
MDINPDQNYGMSQAVASWGAAGGAGKKIDVNSPEFSSDPAYQQFLTNLNFEYAVHNENMDRWSASSAIRESETGQALSSILGAGSEEDQLKAWEAYKAEHPELISEGSEGVNPLQNQDTAGYLQSEGRREAEATAHGAFKKGYRTKSWI